MTKKKTFKAARPMALAWNVTNEDFDLRRALEESRMTARGMDLEDAELERVFDLSKQNHEQAVLEAESVNLALKLSTRGDNFRTQEYFGKAVEAAQHEAMARMLKGAAPEASVSEASCPATPTKYDYDDEMSKAIQASLATSKESLRLQALGEKEMTLAMATSRSTQIQYGTESSLSDLVVQNKVNAICDVEVATDTKFADGEIACAGVHSFCDDDPGNHAERSQSLEVSSCGAVQTNGCLMGNGAEGDGSDDDGWIILDDP